MKSLSSLFVFAAFFAGLALSQCSPAPAFAAESVVQNTHGVFVKGASSGIYAPVSLCYATDGSGAFIPCGKVPGGAGVTPVLLDSSSTNITSSAYVQLTASTSDAATWVDIFNTVAQPLVIAVGSSGHEVDKILVPASGSTGGVNLYIPFGSRLSVKSKGSTGSSGLVLVNMVQ